MSDDYDVGYGKPPKTGQFQPGRSGNPKGRPKGHRNYRTEVEAMLKATVPIRENGQVRHVSTQVAALLRLRELALKGDQKALQTILNLAEQVVEREEARPRSAGVAEADQAIIDAYFEKLQAPADDSAPKKGMSPKTDAKRISKGRRKGGKHD